MLRRSRRPEVPMSRRLLFLVPFSVISILALTGAATWSRPQTTSAKAVCSVGNEGTAAPTSPTDGLDLTASNGIRGFSVVLEANISVDAGAQNVVPAGVYLRAWVFNPNGLWPDGGVGGGWSPAPELDLGPTKGGKLSEAWHGFSVKASTGRLAYLPDTFGNSCTVYINGVTGY